MFSPSLPDNTYKILVYIGIIIISYCIFQSIDDVSKFNLKIDQNSLKIDSLKIKNLQLEYEQKNLIQAAKSLSAKYQIPNPIENDDTTIRFNRVIAGNSIELLVSDSLKNLWEEYKKAQFEIDLYSKTIDIQLDNIKKQQKFDDTIGWNYLIATLFGLTLFVIGYLGMEKLENLQLKSIKIDILNKEVPNKYCQSCGKNFNHYIINGKQENGEISVEFCNQCYDNGQLTEPNLTLKEFEKRVKDILLEIAPKNRGEIKERFKNSKDGIQTNTIKFENLELQF